MSRSAPNTKGQFPVAKLAQGLNAGIIEADVDALESGSAVSCFDALTTARAAMRPGASRIDGSRHFWLRQGAQNTSVDLGIKAGGLDLHQEFLLGANDKEKA